MPRSVRLHPDHKEKARLALERKGFLTQGKLAGNLGIALSTVSNFFNCVAISVAKFEDICDMLDLDPQVIIQSRQSAQEVNEKSFVPRSFVPSLYNRNTWVGRESLITELLSKLQGQTRLLWITGISGIGKTTLGECLASKALDNEPSFQWIYLEILEGQSPDFASVATDLLAKLGDRELDPQERNNPDRLAKRLLQKLQSHPYWLQMDSLERLLNPEQQTEFVDAYWTTFLQRCLTESNIVSRLLLTAQAFPAALVEFNDRYSHAWAEHRLDGLLQVAQQLDFFGKRGVVVEPCNRDILTRIANIYEGHPLVLKVIAEDILKSFAGDVDRYWQIYQPEFEQVARELQAASLDETEYNEALDRKVRERIKRSLEQLPGDALDLLCRSAVFRRPVSKKFWLAMIDDRSPQQQKVAYRVLGARVLIEKEGTDIRQHNLIRSVVYDLLKADTPTWHHAEHQAAHLWLTTYKPAPNAPNLETVRGYLEAFDHYCEVGDWSSAKELFTTTIDTPVQSTLSWQLDIWGYFSEEIHLCEKLLGKCGAEIDLKCWNGIGNGHIDLGNYPKTIEAYKNSLKIARELRNLWGEGSALGNLGGAYYRMGQYKRAIDFHQKHLAIAQKIGDHRGEGTALGNLGIAYHSLRQYELALSFHEQSLVIRREIGDRRGEGIALGNLGIAYNRLKQYGQALSFHEQSLVIRREIGDSQGEGMTLANMGATQLKLKQYPESWTQNRAAFEIFREIGDRNNQAEVLKNLAELHRAQGEGEVAWQYCQQALALATELDIPLAEECKALQLKIENEKLKMEREGSDNKEGD